jgi:hypothetical protein
MARPSIPLADACYRQRDRFMDNLSLRSIRNLPGQDIDLTERRTTFEWLAKGMLLFAGHVLLILLVLGIVFVW